MTLLFKPQPPPRKGGDHTIDGMKRGVTRPIGGFDQLLQELASNAARSLESPRGRRASAAVPPVSARAPPATTNVRQALCEISNHAPATAKNPATDAPPRPPLTSRMPSKADEPTPRNPTSSGPAATPRTNDECAGLPTAEALAIHASCLTLHEAKEIFSYPTIYYCGQRCARKVKAYADVPGSNNYGYDDAQGDYKVLQGDHIGYRYELLQPLGRGSFGQVSKALDHKTKAIVALKIIKNKRKFHEQAQVEIKVLKHLNTKDTDGTSHIVKMLSHMVFRNHTVIVFELHGQSLYELHKSQRFAPMSERVLRVLARQMLQTLLLTQREHVVHCDLKPENVLLEGGGTSNSKLAIRVIDFGSACFDTQRLYTYIQSRFYRAPEVMLGIPYTTAIDMWSLGCMLAEFAGGSPIFPGESEQQQMLLVMETMGLPPKTMIESAPRRGIFFDAAGAPRLTPSSRGRIPRPGTKKLSDFVRLASPEFVDLLQGLLTYEPQLRLRPAEALRHPFFNDGPVPPSAATGGAEAIVLPRLQPSGRRC